MITAAILVIALLLDAVSGEPEWIWSRLPHPAVLMGRAIAGLDRAFNAGRARKARGILCLMVLMVVAWLTGAAITKLPLSPILQVPLVAILLAQRSLVDHVGAVATGLRSSLANGRTEVAKIVGRDTREMDEASIARAAIESAAENLSDGVVAPAFWFLLLGLPGLFVYKIVNTADSMIGYKTPRHQAFGWAAARLDDVLNFIPARLTAVLITNVNLRWNHLRQIRRDAALHRSPNAGWPEAAMAVTLDVALAGPRSYDGALQDFPFVNTAGNHQINAHHVDLATQTLWRAWALMVAAITLLAIA